MKKVLHISKYYYPYKGGIEDMALSIVKILESSFQQSVLCYNDNKSDYYEVDNGIEISRLGVFGSIFSQPLSFNIFSKLKNKIKTYNPDIIHFHAPNPIIGFYLCYLKEKHTKLIIHWHGDIEKRIRLYWLYKPFEKQLLRIADKIIITSPNYVDNSPVLKTHNNKIIVVPNIVNQEKLTLMSSDLSKIEEIRTKYGKKIIFAFGRHVEYKGIEHLIQAEKYITEECNIVIAGEGPLTNVLKKLNHSKRVHFIGRITDDELRQFLYASHIFAFPSISRGEAFGIALAEAMFCGLPSITFTISGSGVNWVSPNLVSGLEVENGNHKSYASAIDKLIIDIELRNKLSNNAKERVMNLFIKEKIENLVIELYTSL